MIKIAQNTPIVIKERINHPQSQDFIPDEYKQVAKGVEEQFLNHMLEEMNKTTKLSENDSEDTANEFYSGLLNSERAKILAQKDGGVGVQKIILDQIYPERLRNQYNYKHAGDKNPQAQTVIKKYSQGSEL